jgi:signal transduction histidine kinase
MRATSWRSVFVTGALLGTMVISAVAAWGIHTTGAEHRRALRGSLDEFARYAARGFGDEMIHDAARLRYRAMVAVIGSRPARTAEALTLAEHARRSGEVMREYGFADDTLVGYFRIDAKTGAYEAAGAATDPELARLLRQRALELTPRLEGNDAPLLTHLDLRGEPVNVGLEREYTAAGNPIAIFGHTASRRVWMALLGDQIIRRLPLLPPSFIPEDWQYNAELNRSEQLVAVQVLDREERELYRSTPWFAGEVQGEFAFRTRPGGFIVRTALHPELVAAIAADHAHPYRHTMLVGLSILSVLLAAAVVVYRMRERELVRAHGDFVASVSHELRTPLAQIRMFSETLMLRRERDEDERLRWVGIIGREARRLGDLVENVLLFSNIDAARLRLECERTDLGELVEDVVEVYVNVVAERGMRIVADAPSRIFVHVDPRATRQVVVNLIDNAIKYGAAGQTISVEVECYGEVASLAVSDQGPGVPPTERERLWRPFVRLSDAGGSVGGSGIGLSVVRELAEKQQGKVAVEDALGGGARFVVTWPALPGSRQSGTTTERMVSGIDVPAALFTDIRRNTTVPGTPGA